ncbi:MAG: TonB-dependent receptor [Nevskiaceae bacterium]|nr:TonB-dependent receptor [Nevskiaceae bacterium]
MPVAFAADGADELTEVTVTGSRIVRRDTEANSPLVSVDSAALESRAGLNVESYLNQLPNFNPAATPTTTDTDVQVTPINTVGIATVSLRGFGANRGLVLLDGRRISPVNSMMAVDINGIPSSMIRRVEIISGGASATYGADAIGGVTNFIMRRDYEGLEADLQYGITEAGDGQETRASALVGTGFGEGRGHVTFAAEYYDRQAAYDKNRSFYTDAWKDPSVGGNFLGFLFGANGYHMLSNPPNPGILGAILDSQGRPSSNIPVFSFPGNGNNNNVRFNGDGSLFLPASNNAWSWTGGIDNARYALYNVYDNGFCNSTNATTCPGGPQLIQQVKYSETETYTSAPQTRYSFMTTAGYDLSDRVHFNTSARFAQSRTKTFLAGTPMSLGWEASIPYNATTDSPIDPALTLTPALTAQILANPEAYRNPNFIAHGAQGAQHPVPVSMALMLNSRTTAPLTTDWVLEAWPLDSFGRRATENTLTSWQIETGLSYDLPVRDWTAELYYSRGETHTYDVAYGDNSLARWRGMVTAADYGRGAELQSNRTNNPGVSPGFASIAVPCTSGFYETIFFGDVPASEDCTYAVTAPLQTDTQTQQDVVEVNLQGGLFELPAGEVRGALGYQYRRNATQFRPDILQSTASFTDQPIGVFPSGYMDAQTKARDFYAEALVPVIKDFGVNKAELELGIRFSDYDYTKSTTTFKILGNIEITDSLRVRGGFNRATRAPNMGEMFLPLQQLFGGTVVFGDPCGLLSNSPFGAGGAAPNPVPGSGGPAVLAAGQTQAGAQSTKLICEAQMGNGTTPGTAAYDFYLVNPQPAAGAGGNLFLNQVGNPNLRSETADTWTAGLVIQSPFDNAWLRGLTATIDWYKISIKDAILPYSVDYARYLCYGTVQVTTVAEAQAQADTDACRVVPRNERTGGTLTMQLSFDNQATVNTSGIDFAVRWNAPLADLGLASVPGGVSLSVEGTWLDYYRTKQSPFSFDPEIEWKGSLGPNLPSFNAGSYGYRLFTTLGYNLPSVGVNLRWRFLPSVVVNSVAQREAVIRNNAQAASGEGTRLSYSPGSNLPVASYSVFDLSGYWNINQMLALRLGIDNLFNRQPASSGRTTGFPYGTDIDSLCPSDPNSGCQRPGAYSLPSSGAGSTSAGYYDVLGRRYYVGLKVRF